MLFAFRFGSPILIPHSSDARSPVSVSSRTMARSRSAVERSVIVCPRVFQLRVSAHAPSSFSIPSLLSVSTTGGFTSGGSIWRTMLTLT
jgi:hypothetical protein